MKIAFDVDDTLYKVVGEGVRLSQVPDYDVINILLLLHKFGAQIYVWSAGGTDYAQRIVDKLGLTDFVKVVIKNSELQPDICFDDQNVELAKVNFKIKRKE